MIHDILRRDHPKDWRCMSMFVLAAYRAIRVFVLRVAREGRLYVEQLVPADGEPTYTVWLAIYEGHMQMVVPPSQGWCAYLEQANDITQRGTQRAGQVQAF